MSDLNFEQKVVRAALFVQTGDPIKDVLNESEIDEAIQRLSDIFVTLGIVDLDEVGIADLNE
jgi:hypothetical protein